VTAFGIDRLLADRALRTALAGRRVALLAHPASVTTDLTHWSEEPQVYLRSRHEVYGVLAGLREKVGAKEVEAYTAKWIADHDRWMQERFEERVKKAGGTAIAE
jgi:uncharacterized protein YbbC (DUF1343 family)